MSRSAPVSVMKFVIAGAMSVVERPLVRMLTEGGQLMAGTNVPVGGDTYLALSL
jgi:hypothetical protein